MVGNEGAAGNNGSSLTGGALRKLEASPNKEEPMVANKACVAYSGNS